jgi:hypothetical protein
MGVSARLMRVSAATAQDSAFAVSELFVERLRASLIAKYTTVPRSAGSMTLVSSRIAAGRTAYAWEGSA